MGDRQEENEDYKIGVWGATFFPFNNKEAEIVITWLAFQNKIMIWGDCNSKNSKKMECS